MARPARSPEENLKIKENILKESLDIIGNEGYENFSMRKLASRLGLTATTIYQYFINKDEIYLAVVEEGFLLLHDRMMKALDPKKSPEENLRSVLYSYIGFGLEEYNLYNIMMVWRVPKYYDFLGSPVEEAAQREMETAMRVLSLAQDTILACPSLKSKSNQEKEDIVLEAICSIHGFISLWNSQVIDYIFSKDEEAINDERIHRYIDVIMNSIEKRK